ncbi:class I SAM-dependent methyltransferase [Yoonia sediminilitoris]|uniref:Ubiquinone/menaquinone biosynthesis C-methylase UbiE n=1 Tax=Yoonia sediminilitoris TaxID=1286148 RepID=A0A2T6K170_9RHOB|nr:methyltransferase domain-containing protein [Yoonia sediminilitoris]PUB08374.1 ubiquinone/menaquinone biosynthesis C-methylase UbiE [Yoonia sediminilitoris]RCW89430.1 ubiquinone/menaquinone biosynthesis C-methylase UbiE [Yoonia sediminilitoris]
MDARLKLRVQRYGWDAAAGYYHASWQAQLRPAHDRLIEMADVKTGQKVIETACGSGLVTLRLADAIGSNGQVLATDLSQGMIDNLRTQLDGHLDGHVTAARMAAEKLDVPDETFDAAICALGLMYTPDPAAAISEMSRVVAPGGTVTATVWGERRNCSWAEVFPIVDAHVASEVCPMFFGTGAPNALKRLFEGAGLQNIQEHRQSEMLVFQSDEDVVEAVLLGGPVALAVKRLGDEDWKGICQEFLASVAEYKKSDGSYGIPGEFVTVRGLRPLN